MRRLLVGGDEVGEASENGLWRWSRTPWCFDLGRGGFGEEQSRLVGMPPGIGMSKSGGRSRSQKKEEASGEEEQRKGEEGGGGRGGELSSMLLPGGRGHRSSAGGCG